MEPGLHFIRYCRTGPTRNISNELTKSKGPPLVALQVATSGVANANESSHSFPLGREPTMDALHPQIRDHFQRIIEAVGEIGDADDQGELDDLPFVVIFFHFQQG